MGCNNDSRDQKQMDFFFLRFQKFQEFLTRPSRTYPLAFGQLVNLIDRTLSTFIFLFIISASYWYSGSITLMSYCFWGDLGSCDYLTFICGNFQGYLSVFSDAVFVLCRVLEEDSFGDVRSRLFSRDIGLLIVWPMNY